MTGYYAECERVRLRGLSGKTREVPAEAVVLPRDLAERIWDFMSRQSVDMEQGRDMGMLARCIANAEPPE